jgi:glutathione synthase
VHQPDCERFRSCGFFCGQSRRSYSGAVRGVPQPGEPGPTYLHVGARGEKPSLSSRDHEISEALGPELKKRGLVFVGSTSSATTSPRSTSPPPTGIQEINGFHHTQIEGNPWEAFQVLYPKSRATQGDNFSFCR